MSTALIVPVYNEFDRLTSDLLFTLCQELSQIDIIFVDDGSTDGTTEFLNQFKVDNAACNFSVVKLANNVGKAEAIREGFRIALNDYRFLAFTDGDFSTPPREIARLIDMALILDCDAILGVRRGNRDSSIETSVFRKWQGRVFNVFAKLLLDLDLQDPQCGMKIFKNTKSLGQALNRPFVNPWLIDLEIILRLKQEDKRFSVQEIQLQEWRHQPKSKVRVLDPIFMLRDLIKLMKIYMRGKEWPKSLKHLHPDHN